MSSVVAFGSTIPRSREGRGWEKRRKDSGEGFRLRVGLGWFDVGGEAGKRDSTDRYLHRGLEFPRRGLRGEWAGPLYGGLRGGSCGVI